MRTELYKDLRTNELMTFAEAKRFYAAENGADLPIDDDMMYLILMENLIQNGGRFSLIRENRDAVLEWCNDYAEHKEADRYLSREERDESVRDIYDFITSGIEELYDGIKEGLKNDKDNVLEARELLERLKKIESERKEKEHAKRKKKTKVKR